MARFSLLSVIILDVFRKFTKSLWINLIPATICLSCYRQNNCTLPNIHLHNSFYYIMCHWQKSLTEEMIVLEMYCLLHNCVLHLYFLYLAWRQYRYFEWDLCSNYAERDGGLLLCHVNTFWSNPKLWSWPKLSLWFLTCRWCRRSRPGGRSYPVPWPPHPLQTHHMCGIVCHGSAGSPGCIDNPHSSWRTHPEPGHIHILTQNTIDRRFNHRNVSHYICTVLCIMFLSIYNDWTIWQSIGPQM